MMMFDPFVWLRSNQLGLATRPGYNGYKQEDIDTLRYEGIKTLWSFLTDEDIEFHGLEDLEEKLAQGGMRLQRSPIEDQGVPSIEQVHAFIEQLRVDLQEGPVALSCSAGVGRTGTMAACFLVTEGKNADDAIDEVREVRFGAVETYEQEEFIVEFEEYWNTV